MAPRALVAAGVLALALARAAGAAEPPAPGPPPASPPPDTRSGHPVIAAHAGWSAALGSIEGDRGQSDRAAWGPVYGGWAGVGVSRYVVLGATGEYGRHGTGSRCPRTTCRTTTWLAGAGAEYHPIGDSNLDPWVRWSAGWRTTTFEGSGAAAPADSVRYAGLEWARLGAGGDWRAARWVSVGPWIEWSLGTYGRRSPGTIDETATHSFFAVGVRGVVDPIR